jgi:hypothetical protein
MHKPEFLIVKEDPTLVRDVGSKALLQTDLRKKEEFMRKKNLLKKNAINAEIVNLRLDDLDQRMKKIESLLTTIAEKL